MVVVGHGGRDGRDWAEERGTGWHGGRKVSLIPFFSLPFPSVFFNVRVLGFCRSVKELSFPAER